jgi:hypothetical protein
MPQRDKQDEMGIGYWCNIERQDVWWILCSPSFLERTLELILKENNINAPPEGIK